MTRPITTFGDSLNWDILYRGTEEAIPDILYYGGHRPIPPREISSSARIFIVGIASSQAKPTWRLGGFLSAEIPISPSSTTQIPGGTEFFQDKIPYGKRKLIELPFYEPPSIKLVIQPPKWFKDVYIEAWYYSGTDTDEARESLIRIEEKIDLL